MQGHYRFKSTRVKLENNSNRLKVDIDFPLWTVVLVAGHGGWLEAGVLVVEGRGAAVLGGAVLGGAVLGGLHRAGHHAPGLQPLLLVSLVLVMVHLQTRLMFTAVTCHTCHTRRRTHLEDVAGLDVLRGRVAAVARVGGLVGGLAVGGVLAGAQLGVVAGVAGVGRLAGAAPGHTEVRLGSCRGHERSYPGLCLVPGAGVPRPL